MYRNVGHITAKVVLLEVGLSSQWSFVAGLPINLLLLTSLQIFYLLVCRFYPPFNLRLKSIN